MLHLAWVHLSRHAHHGIPWNNIVDTDVGILHLQFSAIESMFQMDQYLDENLLTLVYCYDIFYYLISAFCFPFFE